MRERCEARVYDPTPLTIDLCLSFRVISHVQKKPTPALFSLLRKKSPIAKI